MDSYLTLIPVTDNSYEEVWYRWNANMFAI